LIERGIEIEMTSKDLRKAEKICEGSIWMVNQDNEVTDSEDDLN